MGSVQSDNILDGNENSIKLTQEIALFLSVSKTYMQTATSETRGAVQKLCWFVACTIIPT